MKLQIKFISLLLAVLMLLGSMTMLSVVSVSAAEEGTGTGTGTGTNNKEEVEETIDYTTQMYANPEEKLATMLNPDGENEPWLTKGNYSLYVDSFSGEVAYKNNVTGEILFTNPYDVGTSTLGSVNTKNELLSQIVIQYTDNNTSPIFVSYEMAALKDQITVKRIKNGIRVQYTLGREQARKLVPGMISVERFEQVICARALENGITDFEYKKLTAFYLKLTLEGLSERGRAELIEAFPIVEKMEVYVFDQNASEVDKNRIENYIKTYCPEYTYEELDADHAETEFESQDKNPPLFKLALEYTLDENGMTVRLPANGIRFNEALYQLESIQVLPYMGAGNSAYDGYTFYPDGAGALYEFDNLEDTKTRTVRGKVYGTDYAYHTITGTYQQAIRYPVFGVVENTVYHEYSKIEEDPETLERIPVTEVISGSIKDQYDKLTADMSGAQNGVPVLVEKFGGIIGDSSYTHKEVQVDRGYVAIMEEGDALTDIMTYHAGSLSDYNTVKMIFNPRPSDSYNLQDSISVGSDATWTVVSERKYVGNYKIRYVMLSDSEKAEENEVTDYYETSWMGMALAYRDYLDRNGYLTRLTEEDVKDNIPLYIETFGALETTERILSIPVDVMTPLTTFDNIKTMYNELAEEGITNINFKLTGYANGGMYSIVPSKLKWERAVGGKNGFQDLVNYAAEINQNDSVNLGIFPDFDFSYINQEEMFDGVSMYWHAVKTIDDRYASYREYSATKQKHVSHYQMAISPASFSNFYEKLAENYTKFDNVNGISVGTLGNTLNSDFDEDDPYNREDSKEFVSTALSYLSGLKNKQGKEIELMSEGGNAFTWKFLDHLLDVSLDSSRNNDAAHAVPFVGVVLHGYINFAGSPMNMEGNIQYAMLKTIENGAAPYYILSYQNTQNLKEYELLSHYYSVRYDIWKDDVVEMYGDLNAVLGDVQDKLIIDHEFWDGTRVPDSDELFDDIQAVLDEYLYAEENAGEVIALQKKQAVSIARKQAREAAEAAIASIDDAAAAYKQAIDMFGPFQTDVQDLATYYYGATTLTTDQDGNPIKLSGVKGLENHVCGKDAWDDKEKAIAEAAGVIHECSIKITDVKGLEHHVCGKDIWDDADKAIAAAAGVSHECGFKVFEDILASGEIDYNAYEEFSDAEEGEEGYEEYQLFLAFRSARSRFTTTRNRRMNDAVNIYNYFAKAQTALIAVEEHLAIAEKALKTLNDTLATTASAGESTEVLDKLIEESTTQRDLVNDFLYLNENEYAIVLDRYQKGNPVYIAKGGKVVVTDLATGEIIGEFSPEDDIEAINQYLIAAVQKGFDDVDVKLHEDIAKVQKKLEEDLVKAEASAPGEIEKIKADAAKEIVKIYEQMKKDLADAQVDKTPEQLEEIDKAIVAVQEKLANDVIALYQKLLQDVADANATITDEAERNAAVAKLYEDAQLALAQLNQDADNQIVILGGTVEGAQLKAKLAVKAANEKAEQKIAEVYARPQTLKDTADAEIAKLEAKALETKTKFNLVLTTDQIKEIKALTHFEYDFSKVYDRELNELATYYSNKLTTEIAGEVYTEENPGLDFYQQSYRTYSEGVNSALDDVLKLLIKEDYNAEGEEGIKGQYGLSYNDFKSRITAIGSSGSSDEEETVEEFDKYAVEEGSIVIVTYGGKNGVDNDPYKSIILNYNNFSVSLEYDGMLYTLPAYGYVVVNQ